MFHVRNSEYIIFVRFVRICRDKRFYEFVLLIISQTLLNINKYEQVDKNLVKIVYKMHIIKITKKYFPSHVYRPSSIFFHFSCDKIKIIARIMNALACRDVSIFSIFY